MIDLQNNDATHGDETYQDQFTTAAFNDAKEQIFNSLHNGDEDIKAIAIDALIQDEGFWSAVFNIGANESLGYPKRHSNCRHGQHSNICFLLCSV